MSPIIFGGKTKSKVVVTDCDGPKVHCQTYDDRKSKSILAGEKVPTAATRDWNIRHKLDSSRLTDLLTSSNPETKFRYQSMPQSPKR